MTRLLGIGIVVQILACGVVGVRLLWLSARTRRAPELLLGTAFLMLGVVGYPLAIVARGGPGGMPSANLLVAALAAQNIACLCMYGATWRTFHPELRGGAAILGLGLW